ncbi:acetyltransferase, GNAT family [delta proteobacterium NaphS2]|nr:acetyltransferase, GNAT family [delta proteobacterium NaphS2]
MEIWEKKGDYLDPKRSNEIERAYIAKLEIEMKNGNCIAWVIEDKESVVASGAVTFISLVPNPSDLSSKVAYLHSMYTEKSYRNKKCAQQIIQKAIGLCASQGVKRIMLNASDAGQPVYQKIGFRSAPDTMRLFIAQV